MLTLGLECSQNKLVVVLLKHQKCVASFVSTSQNTSESILEGVQSVLQEAQTTLDAITHILFGNGPGSFTSLRIGLATLFGLFAFTPTPPQIATISSLKLRLLSLADPHDSALIAFPARLQKKYVGWQTKEGYFEACLTDAEWTSLLKSHNFSTCLAVDSSALSAEHHGQSTSNSDPISAQVFEKVNYNSMTYIGFINKNISLNYLQPEADVASQPSKTVF